MSGSILVLNCGSSSIKFALYEAKAPPPRRAQWKGSVEGIGGEGATFEEGGGDPCVIGLDPAQPYHAALARILDCVETRAGGARVAAVAHRVVHGGAKYFAPARIDAATLADLRSYIPLAPLHQPFALDAIETLLQSHPDLAQVACFDTAFHHTMPDVEKLLPLPFDAWQRGLRRYGFHGLSYEYLSITLAERHGDAARGRTICAHLGSGASLCAMRDLRSVATTMGFSALDGLMMGTRCGALDPGALLYLMEVEKLGVGEVADLLYRRCGLLGVSGVSPDPRVLLPMEAGDERVRLALALYVRRIVREIGALAAALGGLDLLVFTAGIGEHNAELRARVCLELGWLGVELDAERNAEHAPTISTAASRIAVAVEPTDEEWIAAKHAAVALGIG